MIRQVPEGLIVKYRHERRLLSLQKLGKFDTYGQSKLDPNGGRTVATIFDAEGNKIIEAEAICSPRDAYNKRLGRTIALGRALCKLDNP